MRRSTSRPRSGASAARELKNRARHSDRDATEGPNTLCAPSASVNRQRTFDEAKWASQLCWEPNETAAVDGAGSAEGSLEIVAPVVDDPLARYDVDDSQMRKRSDDQLVPPIEACTCRLLDILTAKLTFPCRLGSLMKLSASQNDTRLVVVRKQEMGLCVLSDSATNQHSLGTTIFERPPTTCNEQAVFITVRPSRASHFDLQTSVAAPDFCTHPRALQTNF